MKDGRIDKLQRYRKIRCACIFAIPNLAYTWLNVVKYYHSTDIYIYFFPSFGYVMFYMIFCGGPLQFSDD